MTFVWVKRDTTKRISQLTITPETVEKIADLLNIPPADRGKFLSGTICIGTSPTSSPPRADAQPSPPSGPASPSSGGRRSRK
jgi:hypothetical protein